MGPITQSSHWGLDHFADHLLAVLEFNVVVVIAFVLGVLSLAVLLRGRRSLP